MGHDDGHKSGSQRIADGPGTLHQGERLGAVVRRPGFRDQSGACGPFAAHAEAEQYAADHQLTGGVGEAAERGGDRVAENAKGERADAAEAVSKPAEGEAAHGRGDERGRHHGATHGGGEVHLQLDGAEDKRVDHHVHAVEHPAEGGGQERALLHARRLDEPAGDLVQERTSCIRVLTYAEVLVGGAPRVEEVFPQGLKPGLIF